jgi:TonB-linked SusC/RagA family outer membrane protein
MEKNLITGICVPLFQIKKLLRIMKLTSVIFFVFSVGLSANSYSQKAEISLNVKNERLEDVLQAIRQQSEFSFWYNDNEIDLNKLVSINVTNENIQDVIKQTLKDQDVSFKIFDKHVILYKPVLVAGEVNDIYQELKITGKITDASTKEPLPGVNITVEGTTVGTVSDLDGNFTINASNNAVLVFSYIGYISEKYTVTGGANVDIQLVPDIKSLEEVVVVGYGVQRKSDVAGAISVATAEDVLRGSSFNALQGLKGKAAGVNVFTNSGNPSGNTRVVIRGINSINTSSDPLYVVDGVQMTDFQLVNPNDIERMEVLKDASAAAIYGARGANGVILITTKRGAGSGEGVTVSYNGWVSMSTLAKKVDLMNSKEFMQMEDIGFSNFSKYEQSASKAGMTVDRSDPLLFDANGNPLYDTDWQEEATRHAISYNHQLNIQQQGKNSAVGAFLNFTDQEGIMLNNYMKRVSGKFTYDANPKKWLSTGVNLLVNHNWGNDLDETGGGQTARRTMWEMPPILPVKFPDGSWANSQFTGNKLNLGLEAMSNPVHELETRKMNRFRTKIFGNAFLNFHLAEGLDLKTQFGVDANRNTDKNFSPNDLINISAPNGRANISESNRFYWQEETFLTYNKAFGKHRLNTMAGLSWSQSSLDEMNTGDVSGFTTNYFGYENLGAATTTSAPSSNAERWSLNSYFLRGSYTLNDKYLATVTARVDGSSRFGKNNYYGFFPSAALGWVISNEDFLKNVNWLTNLKLHTSYGRTGNTEIDPYSTLSKISSGTVLINGSRASSAYVSGLANPDLQWEKTDQFDLGINLGLIQNRINLELDYYYKLTSDLLLEKPLPYSTGFSSVVDNIGEVSNRGFDILLSTVNIKTEDFTWESTLNANYNTNKIEKLGENDEDILRGPSFVGGDVILRVGESLSSFYGYKRYGTWGTDEKAEAAAVGAVPGEAKRSESREIIGKGLPDWTGSFVNTLNYKNWDFTFDLQFVYGVDTWQLFFHSMEDRSGIANGFTTILNDAWTESNQNTMIQQIRQQNYSGQNSLADSHWVADGSYLRGNLIQLGYSFKAPMLDKWKLKALRAYVSVSNAFLIHSSEFLGYDPEAVSNNEQFGQNIFFYQYPKPRTFTFGVNVSF